MAKEVIKVTGPPGTGKTHWLLEQMSSDIANGIHPQEMLFASFSRAASYGGRDRCLAQFPQYSKDDFINYATIHSIAYRLLGLTPYSVFAHKQLTDFGKEFRYDFSSEQGKDYFSQDLVDMNLVTNADYYEDFISWQAHTMLWDNFDEAYRIYTQKQLGLPDTFSKRELQLYIERRNAYKQQNGLWDFQDMLVGVLDRQLSPPGVKVCFYDEQQDSSKLLYEVAKLWSQDAERSYWAADPYQAIFSWMGADPTLFIDMQASEEVRLTQSYRCPRSVYELSRKIVDRMKLRYPQDDFIPTNSGGIVTKLPMEKVNFDSSGSVFALFRTRYLMEGFEEQLLRQGIPFTTRRGKQSPLDKGGKDIVLNLLKLYNNEQIYINDLYQITKAIPQQPYLARGAKTDIKERVKENPSHKVSKVSLPALGFTTEFIYLLNTGDYLECLKNPPEEKRYFRKLLQRYGRQGLTEEPKLQVGTIHSAKGLEASKVLLSTELTRLPFENLMRNPDEEHRIMYVAVTRSQEEVNLLLPESWRSYPL